MNLERNEESSSHQRWDI